MIKSYYSEDNGNIKIYLGDCLEILDILPMVNLIFTDPPYMISNEVVITRGRNKMKFKGKDIKQDFGEWDKFDSLDKFMQWTFLWVKKCVRILKDGGMFSSYFDRDKINFLSRYLQDKYNFKCKGYYADLKSNPVPQARKVKWMNGWEIIGLWQAPNGKLTFNYRLGQAKDWGIRPIVGHTTKADGNRSHPTQKPISIAKKFISYWSNEGDIILDCFMGSGFVAIACKELNRKFIGIEISQQYCDIAIKRLQNTTKLMF